jgi:RNA polymerase sigma-54 factor
LKALISWQEDFFLARSNSLRPLFQWQLAESISVHPSTLGRTIRNKYLQCKQGTFPLSYFFSKKVGNQADAPSEMEIKIKITQIITNENKRLPLSDEKLRKNLHAFGIDISRRTVAKYRSELGFSPSYLRKAK